MPAADPITSERRRFSLRLPQPLWIGLATVVLVTFPLVAAVADDSAISDPGDGATPGVPLPGIFGSALDEWAFGAGMTAASARQQLDVLLRQKIEVVDRACQLSDVQKQKLQLMGHGDMRRFFDRADEIKRRFLLAHDELIKLIESVQSEEAAEINMKIFIVARKSKNRTFDKETQLLKRQLKIGLSEADSLFARGLERTLTAEQLANYEPLRAVYRIGGVVQMRQFGSDEVLEINLVGTAFADDDLALLSKLPGLQSLYLGNTPVTDAGLVHLKGMTSLQQLWLDNTQVTDVGVAELQRAVPGLTIRNRPDFAKSLTITIVSAANGEVGSVTVGLAKLFAGPLDTARLRLLDRRLTDAFAIEGTFDQVLLRVGTNLDFGELMKIIDVCTRQKMADGKPVNKISFLELGDQEAAVDMSLKLPVVDSAHPVDTKGAENLLVLNVSTKGEFILAGQPNELERYLAKEAAFVRKKLQLEGKKLKPGDELPTMIVVRAGQ